MSDSGAMSCTVREPSGISRFGIAFPSSLSISSCPWGFHRTCLTCRRLKRGHPQRGWSVNVASSPAWPFSAFLQKGSLCARAFSLPRSCVKSEHLAPSYQKSYETPIVYLVRPDSNQYWRDIWVALSPGPVALRPHAPKRAV